METQPITRVRVDLKRGVKGEYGWDVATEGWPTPADVQFAVTAAFAADALIREGLGLPPRDGR